MPKDGSITKTKIISETTSLVLENGFAGTTIDLILDKTQITKGAFFYHFHSKADLALGIMNEFARSDAKELEDVLKDTEKYQKNPRKRLLKFIDWFIDRMSGLESPYPGCLYASYVYEPEQYSEEIKGIVAHAILMWRDALVKLLNAAAKHHKVRKGIDIEALADHFTVILEGAFVVSKALDDAKLTARQLIHYRHYLELLFAK